MPVHCDGILAVCITVAVLEIDADSIVSAFNFNIEIALKVKIGIFCRVVECIFLVTVLV